MVGGQGPFAMRPDEVVVDEVARITFTSCEVRKPSKKCKNGTRLSSVAV